MSRLTLVLGITLMTGAAPLAHGQAGGPPENFERVGVDFNTNPPTFSPPRPMPPGSALESPGIVDPASQHYTTCPRPGQIPNELPSVCDGVDRPAIGCHPIWFDNLALVVGFDGARGPDDLGINANVGGRIALQTSFPLIEEFGLGLQIGSAVNYHNTATRFQTLNGGPHERTQSFTTLGIFQRAESGVVWGVAYDYLNSHSYANFDLGQWRALAGYRFNANNEVGVWATYKDRGDAAQFAGESFRFRAINMANLYFTHFWEHNAMSRIWVGLADQHGRAILGIPGGTPTYNAFVYGAEFQVPLSPYISLFAEANLVTPLDSGCVHAFVGVAFYPGGSAYQATRNRFAPMFPLANNANFSVDALR